MGQGAFLTSHPDVEEINRMLGVGHTPDEVSKWLKEKYKNKRYWASAASIQNYRKNILNFSKVDLAQKRMVLLAEGKTRAANGIALHQTTTELIETKQQVKTEVVKILENFKSIQEVVLERMDIIRKQTVDDMGLPIFKRSNDEMLEKYLGRLESITNSFIKASKDISAPEQSAQTNITITTAEIQKYSDSFKGILQRLVAKFDPALLPEVFRDFDEEIAKLGGQTAQSQVQISVGAGGNNQINIITGAQAAQLLPTPEEVTTMAEQMTNENDYVAEDVINTIIETKINN